MLGEMTDWVRLLVYFQQSVDQITMNDQLQQIEELTTERDKLRNEVGVVFLSLAQLFKASLA